MTPSSSSTQGVKSWSTVILAEGPASFSSPTRTSVSIEDEPVILPGGEGETTGELDEPLKKFGGKVESPENKE